MKHISASDIVAINGPLHPDLTIGVSRFIRKYPGQAVLLMKLGKIKMSQSIPTAGTDGATIWFNPEFIDKIKSDPDHILFLIGHETWHIVFQHPKRAKHWEAVTFGPDGKKFCFKRYNVAADLIINKMLHEGGCGKFIVGGQFDPNLDWADVTVDEVYKTVPEQPDQPPGEGKDGEGDTDVHIMPDSSTNTPSQSKVNRTMAQAKSVEQAHGQGSGAGMLSRLFDDMVESKVDWKQQFRALMVTGFGHDEYSYARIDRRAIVMPPHMVMPAPIGYSMKALMVELDISGSVGKAATDAVLSELVYMIEQTTPVGVFLFLVDDSVRDVIEVDIPNARQQLIGMEMPHGGGTDMEVAWPAIYEKAAAFEDAMIVVLTDGYTNTDNQPKYDVVWLTTESTDLSYGTVIKLEV